MRENRKGGTNQTEFAMQPRRETGQLSQKSGEMQLRSYN